MLFFFLFKFSSLKAMLCSFSVWFLGINKRSVTVGTLMQGATVLYWRLGELDSVLAVFYVFRDRKENLETSRM